jgi:poly(3-hydroxybutyrate) depolymerase
MTKTQKIIVLPAFGALALLGGAIAGYSGLAAAQGTATATAPTQMQGTSDPSKGGHVGQNGMREEILTGDIAAQVSAAAQAAEPGATIDRMETDAEGAAYEAHMTRADGSRITLKFDTSFKVTATESGHRSR